MDSIGKRIEKYRKELGISQVELAAKSGVSQPTIADLEKGKHATSKKLPAIARALGVTVGDLDPEFKKQWIFLDSTTEGPHDIKNVPVVGFTQAGVWTEFESFEDDGFHGEQVPHVPGKWAKLQQYAFKVRGNSMDADRIFDGDFVVVVNYFEARSDIVDGDRVVIERVRNSATERTIKQIEIKGKEVHFCPRSSDSRYKPIIVKISHQMREADDTEVRLVGLVIGRWSPF